CDAPSVSAPFATMFARMDPATTLLALARRAARESPDRPAVLAPGRVACTYEQLAHQMAAVGSALRAAGIAREDRVAVALANGAEMATAFLGVTSTATC